MKKIYLLFILTSLLMAGCQNEDDSANPVKWDGAAAESFDTKTEPFMISSPAQLKLLSDIVSGLNTNPPLGATDSSSYELTKGIDMNNRPWTPIGSKKSPFKGSFDGGNHTIKGVLIDSVLGYQGLFGSIEDAIVKRINLVDCSITAGDFVINNDNNGSIAGYCKNGIIEDCTFTGTFNNKGNGAGGIVGKMEGNNARVSNCHNLGVLYSSVGCRVGGIVGFNKGGLIEDCSNSAIISGSGYYVGGIAGQSYNGSVINCYNTANVSGLFNIGGLVGINMNSLVSNCFNTGNLNNSINGDASTDGDITIGGVAGYSNGALINCYNSGIINTPSTENGFSIGGVVGYSTGIVSSCYYLSGCAKNGLDKPQNGVGALAMNTSIIDIDGSTNVFTEIQGKALPGNTGAKIGIGQFNDKSALVDCLNAWQSANSIVRNRWTLTGSKTGYPVFVGVLNR